MYINQLVVVIHITFEAVKMRTLIILALGLAIPTVSLAAKRIIGGDVTTIEEYPFAAALLLSPTGLGIFNQECTGSIINVRAVLTAAQCFERYPSPSQWRVRVGSTSSSKDGVIQVPMRIIPHESYNRRTLDNDIAILRIIGAFSFDETVAVGTIPPPNHPVGDNTQAWLVGWGSTLLEGPFSDELRRVQVRIMNHNACRNAYTNLGYTITNNMLCTTTNQNNNVGDACYGDTGGPVVHDGVIVGIMSWTYQCGDPRYHGVNIRVSQYENWIQSNQ